MTDSDFVNLCERAFQDIRARAPKRTGNLAFNGVRLVFASKKEALLYVDEAVAPYMPYTNEPWVSPKWHGKQNPNESWFNRAAESIAEMINRLSKGELKHVDD